MEKEKILKNKRMSLDPAKNPLIGLQKHHNTTELEVRNTSHEESQSIINKESDPYPSEQLPRIFQTIAKGSDRINCESLYSLLREEGYGDNLYAAVEMIALVDYSRKGYVTKEEFVNYFTRNYDQEKLPPLPAHMVKRKKWVQAIQQNLDVMKQYAKKEYCQYVADTLKEEVVKRTKR